MRLLTYLQSLATDYSARVHANGFIQIDLSPAVRLHVWGDPRIPKQKVPTPIHDHAFAFTSRVLLGRLTNRLYVAEPITEPGPSNVSIMQPHRARIRHGEDTTLVAEGPAVYVRRVSTTEVCSLDGYDLYSMAVGELHETVPSERPAVSVIIKTGASLSQGGPSPLVMVPFGQTPSNEFDRHAALTPDEMWRIVDDVVAKSGDAEHVATGIAWALRCDLVEEIS